MLKLSKTPKTLKTQPWQQCSEVVAEVVAELEAAEVKEAVAETVVVAEEVAVSPVRTPHPNTLKPCQGHVTSISSTDRMLGHVPTDKIAP